MEKKYDFLVIGTGLGGLSFALKAAEHGSVCLISKVEMEETNTRYAQGGIAAVTYEPDSLEKHVEDTLVAGDHLCNEEVVRMVVNEGPEQIRELIPGEPNLTRQSSGKYDLAREGGHSEHRILHHKDNTGQEIQRALSVQVRKHPEHYYPGEPFCGGPDHPAPSGETGKRHMTDIECYGAYVLNLRRAQR